MLQAIQRDDVRTVEQLLDEGFPVQSIVKNMTLLGRAVYHGHENIIHLLLNRGANIHQHDNVNKESPLHIAMCMNSGERPHIVELLLAHGANPNAKDMYGNTPLMEASKSGYLQSMRIILSHGARINDVNSSGNTALERTCCHLSKDSREIAAFLLDHGADIHQEQEEALRMTLIHGNEEVMEELLERGADIHAICRHKKPIIAEAIRGIETCGKNSVGIIAREFRDWLVRTANDENNYPIGTHPFDRDPLLLKKIVAAIGTEDYKQLMGIIEKAFYVLEELGLSHSPENVCNLIRPKANEQFAQMEERIHCFSLQKCRDIRDMFEEVSDTLFLPSAQLLSGYPQKHFEKHHNSMLQEAILSVAIETLLQGKNIEDILGLSEAWHSPRYDMPLQLRPLAALGEWNALSESATLPSGYRVVCRTSAKQLLDETRMLGHCVGKGSYAARCLDGDVHILSILDRSGTSISTIDIRIADSYAKSRERVVLPGGKFSVFIAQHRGRNNGPAPADAQKVFKEWKKLVEKGKIPIRMEQRGETAESVKRRKSASHSKLESTVGFPISWENVERVFLHYRGTDQSKGLRGVQFNVGSSQFEDDRRNHLIVGQYHETDTLGNRTGRSVRRENLTLEQWLEATGAKQKLLHIIKTHISEPPQST